MSDQNFDAVAFWAALPADVQKVLGELTMGLLYCQEARDVEHFGDVTDPTDAANAWFKAECKAYDKIFDLLNLQALKFDIGTHPLPPVELMDRKCRVCGCTDHRACVSPGFGACWWVETDLCSACAPQANADGDPQGRA